VQRALTKVQGFGLDAQIVSFGAPTPSMLAMEKTFT
jgi:hypothetical protein